MSELIPFVDAHIHLWDLAHIHYPWLSPPFAEDGPNGSVKNIAQDYGIAQYRADVAKWNMVGAVHIDAGAALSDSLRETEWLESLAAQEGLPNAIVAFAALEDQNIDALLKAHATHRHVRGIRQIVNWHSEPNRSYTPHDMTENEQWQQGYGLLARYGLSFDLQCYPGQMPCLAQIIARYPDIPVIVNHMGMPVVSDPEGIVSWRSGMKNLASLPHVAVKLSGLGFIFRDWTYEKIRPFLAETVEMFGTKRCLFASDTPTDTLFAPFDRTLEAYHKFASQYSDDERRDMFGRNANRVYRLQLSL